MSRGNIPWLTSTGPVASLTEVCRDFSRRRGRSRDALHGVLTDTLERRRVDSAQHARVASSWRAMTLR